MLAFDELSQKYSPGRLLTFGPGSGESATAQLVVRFDGTATSASVSRAQVFLLPPHATGTTAESETTTTASSTPVAVKEGVTPGSGASSPKGDAPREAKAHEGVARLSDSKRDEGAHVRPSAATIDTGVQTAHGARDADADGLDTAPHITARPAPVQIGLCGACGLVLDLVQHEIDTTVAAGGPVGIPLRTEVELTHGRVALQPSPTDPTAKMPETVSGLDAFWDELQVRRHRRHRRHRSSSVAYLTYATWS